MRRTHNAPQIRGMKRNANTVYLSGPSSFNLLEKGGRKMKKLSIIFFSLILIFTSNLAFGGMNLNLIGTWLTDGVCLQIGSLDDYGNDNLWDDGEISLHNERIVIVWQDEGLFKGYVCGVEYPNGIFFGTIDNKNFTMTQWDAIVKGEIKKKGNKYIMRYTSQHALKNPPSAPGTCIGQAIKISDEFVDCEPGDRDWSSWPEQVD